MKKYGDVEKAEILRGEEAQVVHRHMERTGRYKLSDFTKAQREELQRELETIREEDESRGSDDSNESPSGEHPE